MQRPVVRDIVKSLRMADEDESGRHALDVESVEIIAETGFEIIARKYTVVL